MDERRFEIGSPNEANLFRENSPSSSGNCYKSIIMIRQWKNKLKGFYLSNSSFRNINDGLCDSESESELEWGALGAVLLCGT